MTPVEVGPGRRDSTPGSRSDAEARQEQLRTGLDSARRWAGAWRTGLAGLLALITTVSVVKGRDTITDLDRPYRYIVGMLLLSALVAAVAGALWAMRAAYGDAELVPHDKDLSVWRVEKIGDITAKITCATRAT